MQFRQICKYFPGMRRDNSCRQTNWVHCQKYQFKNRRHCDEIVAGFQVVRAESPCWFVARLFRDIANSYPHGALQFLDTRKIYRDRDALVQSLQHVLTVFSILPKLHRHLTWNFLPFVEVNSQLIHSGSLVNGKQQR